ncbi:MAG: hypothetical protein HY558_02060 [Euryarchaeota archaeon]|nr:hypothetical protein [Euryarchaeota archaeon]
MTNHDAPSAAQEISNIVEDVLRKGSELIPREETPGARLLQVLAALVLGAVGLAIFATLPGGVLTYGSEHAFLGVIHGTVATVYLLMATVSLYLAYRLYIGKLKAFSDLLEVSLISGLLAIVTNAWGLWLYRHYRDPAVHGHETVRQWLLANVPEAHKVFFEFKEHIALVTIPLTFAAAYLLWRYRERSVQDAGLRRMIAILLGVAWFALVSAFILGAAITKIRSV